MIPMRPRIRLTHSRAGHWTVSIYESGKRGAPRLFTRNLLSSKFEAMRVGREEMARIVTEREGWSAKALVF